MTHKLSHIPLLAGLMLAACGGGDGTDIPPLFSSISYSGTDTQAVITLQNAPDLLEELFGNRGFIADPTDPTSHPRPYHVFIPLALMQAMQRINRETTSPTGTQETSLLEVINCDSGYLDYVITVNELNGVFSGQMTFHDCESAAVCLTGSASIVGVYDLDSVSFREISLSFSLLTGSNRTFRVVSSGHIEILLSDPVTLWLYDYAFRNRVDGPVVRFDDFSLVLQEQDLFTGLTLTGTFYHPDFGHTQVSTPTPITFTADVYWPLFGQVIMTGANSSLRALFDDNNLYTLFVDENGDDTTFEMIVGYWEQP